MQHFYSTTEDELLQLPKSRFWKKFKNMLLIQTEMHKQHIEELAISRSKDLDSYLYKIRWTLEQMSGKEKVDDLSDWKMKFGKKKKKKKVKEQ